MSVRRDAATGPRVGRQSSRLDEVLRAGQAHCQENETDPTGVVGPLLSNLPATVTRLRGQNVPSYAPPPPTNPTAPRFVDDNSYSAGLRESQLKYQENIPVNNAKADGVSYNGIYTGKTYQGIPEGEGTLLVDTSLYFKAYEELVTMQEHLRTSYKRPSKLTIDGTWYEGQLVDGEIKATDTSRVFGTKMQASKFIKDNRPFGDTTRQVSLLQEVRTLKDESRNIQGGSLVDKIYVENAESAISWTGLTATMNLHGKIRWTTRPTAHKFAWASDVEDLRMSDGKGTLTVNFDYHEYTNNPVLTGRAMVTLFPRKSLHAQAHGKDGVLEKANHRYDRGIVLVGNMVQNRLEGVVLAAVPIPGVRFPDNDFRFFIKGYDSDGAPIVRLAYTHREGCKSSPTDATGGPVVVHRSGTG